MTNYPIDELVPHSGTMSLLDKVVDHGEDWLTAEVTINPDTLFLTNKAVPAWIGIEYMAQAIAAFAGILAKIHQQDVKLGFLLGTRKYISSVSNFPIGTRLLIRVEKELQSDDGLGVFNCSIDADNITINARLNVFQPKDTEQFFEQEGLKSE
jgi:predicted hotdog family 3-hydroxylacyl-ACP dehydratase